MKPKYKLKSWVVISVYIISIGAIVTSLFLIGKTLKEATAYDNLSYIYRGIISNRDVPVIEYVNDEIFKPYENETVKVLKGYYDRSDDPKVQEKALIYYQNTYMPNTGILYSSNESFDVISVLDGKVEDVKTDNLIGNIVTIKHSNNLFTSYQSLNEVMVSVGDEIKQGDLIGTSGPNQITPDSENMLLFEVIYNGVNINPESFYQMNIKDLS
ncbi:MAG TPA: M23 family metallopeptidase [Mollicutes bacterium]|nr:M23 family metallopeptidase [Mollicutes bacterium]